MKKSRQQKHKFINIINFLKKLQHKLAKKKLFVLCKKLKFPIINMYCNKYYEKIVTSEEITVRMILLK
jgi:hypothetical protein